MRFIADLQIHSKYSRATSSNMNLQTIAYFAGIKGLDIVGTGDIIHPKWFGEVSEQLTSDDDAGLYRLLNKPQYKARFMVTTEVSTVYVQGNRSRKVHHCILMPSLEVATQVADALKGSGDLEADGRPIISLTSPELVERLMQISEQIEIFPAHSWTPWWSIFGSNSGFDSMEECYADQVDHIHALETGLSSDPPMNWRLSALDRYTLLSNSDCHSPYPHRLGREANIFELDEPSYFDIIEAVRRKDPKRLLFTIETKPEYGKYHWTGHRACKISMPPFEALRLNDRCPKCGRTMTRGVEQRVEQLADRPLGFRPENAPNYVYLLPLHELIASILQDSNPLSKGAQRVYDALVRAFRDEFAVMLDAPLVAIKEVAGEAVRQAIQAVREGTLRVIPGYDGVYGQIELPLPEEVKGEERIRRGRATLEDFY